MGGGEKATPPVPVYPSPHQLKIMGGDEKSIEDDEAI